MPWYNVVNGEKRYRFCGYCGFHFNKPQVKHLCDRCIENNITNPCNYLDWDQFEMKKYEAAKKAAGSYEDAMTRLMALVNGEDLYGGGIVSGRESDPVV